MATRVLGWRNTEAMVVKWLNAGLTAPRKAVTDLPNPLDPALPLAQIILSTGSADSEVTVYDRVDVYNMAATRSAMWALTAETHELMRSLGGAEIDGQPIDLTRVVQRPSFLAWSATVPRSIAVYEIQYRPRPV
jgi:hypothetical protein